MTKTRRTRVFVAGPMALGDSFLNVREGILAADKLLERGYAPYLPHVGVLWHMVSPHDAFTWRALDIEFLPLCDAVLRLPGESVGADGEVQEAMARKIPVYWSFETLFACERETRPE